jgi:hypothetical protein
MPASISAAPLHSNISIIYLVKRANIKVPTPAPQTASPTANDLLDSKYKFTITMAGTYIIPIPKPESNYSNVR